MKILVLAKVVPNTAHPRTLDAQNGLLQRGVLESVPDEINERTLEHALRYRDAGGAAEVTVLSMVPSHDEASVRKYLAMGADSAVMISDDALSGADAVRTAAVLAAAVQRSGADLVLAGNESTDGRGGVVPAMVAEHLGWPVLPALDDLQITADGSVTGTVTCEGETLTLTAPLPAVATVTERSAEARFPNFKGIMQAKKKPLERVSLDGLELTNRADTASVMVAAQPAPARQAGVKVVDDGTAAEALADFLSAQRLL